MATPDTSPEVTMPARASLTPQLGWLQYLTEAGPPITRLADEELRAVDAVLDAERTLKARRESLQEFRARALEKVRPFWTPKEIQRAKERMAEEAPVVRQRVTSPGPSSPRGGSDGSGATKRPRSRR